MIDTINELAAIARELNAKSDKLNSIITAVNEKLGKLNLGIETFLIQPIDAEDQNTTDEKGDPTAPYRAATLLGYARVDDVWQLAVEQTTLVEIIDPDLSGCVGCEHDECRDSFAPTALLKAPRAIRIKAMSLLPSLLDLLKSEATRLSKHIDAAERAAAEL